MLADTLDTNGNIELIENSGIQFLDFEIAYEPSDVPEDEAPDYALETPFICDNNKYPVRLLPTPVQGRVYNPLTGQVQSAEGLRAPNADIPSVQDSIVLYEGVWFPLPFFNEVNRTAAGPCNWARGRIVDIGPKPPLEELTAKKYQGQKKGKKDLRAFKSEERLTGHYHITLAFDTKVQEQGPGGYFGPSPADIESGNTFSLCRKHEELLSFLQKDAGGKCFVTQWLLDIFTTLGPERLRGLDDEDNLQDQIKDKVHLMHYLNILSLLQLPDRELVRTIKIIGSSYERSGYARPVSLVLDIGNSRSCGLLFEQAGAGSDDSLTARRLYLRDFNAPDQIYSEPFQSKIEFAPADFDFDNNSALSGYIHAFEWPSVARVGKEAAALSALRKGNEGLTGKTSPKRYLWSTKASSDSQEWNFNPYSYLTKSKTLDDKRVKAALHVWSDNVSRYICASGNAAFNKDENDDDVNMKALFSGKSTMTFMLLEIFAQTLMQINSAEYRLKTSDKKAPRRLDAVILTYPPAMSVQEQKIFYSCAEDALGILWKSMGYDKSDRNTHPKDSTDIYPAFPKLFMDWNEAEGAQIVYLFNEAVQIFGGNGKQFLQFIRRPDADGRFLDVVEREEDDAGEQIKARLASIDIGGGTCDLCIRDYSFPKESTESQAQIYGLEILRDGFKVAGDDIIKDIIRMTVIPALKEEFKKGCGDESKLDDFIGNKSDDERLNSIRQRLIQQIFIPVALRIMSHLESSFKIGEGITSGVRVEGTIGDFLTGKEVNSALADNKHIILPKSAYEDNLDEIADVLSFYNGKNGMGRYLKEGFKLEDVRLAADLSAMNQNFAQGTRFSICRQLDYLSALVALYRCDVLILTGRPSKISGIHSFFSNRLNLSSSRIIAMHDYKCRGSWYPFAREGGKIGDPKTTAAVGAMLSYARSEHSTPVNFRYFNSGKKTNPMRYLGIIDDRNKIIDYWYQLQMPPVDDLFSRKGKIKDRTSYEPFTGAGVPAQDQDGANEFSVQLPAKIGFKQFINQNFDAQPLYCIEMIEDQAEALEKNPNVKALKEHIPSERAFEFANVLNRLVLGEGEFEDEIRALKEEFAAKAKDYGEEGAQQRQALLERQLQELSEQRQQKINEGLAQYDAQNPPPSGLFSKFSSKAKQEYEQKRTAFYQNLVNSAESVYQEKAGQLRAQAAGPDMSDLSRLMRSTRREINNLLEKIVERDLRSIRTEIRQRNLPIKISLKADESQRIESGSGLDRKVCALKITKVKADGSSVDLTDYVELKLMTVSKSDETYWIDTGILI